MRIIAGKLKSRRIKTLKGEQTRPTSDRVKEAIFNKIGPYFEKGNLLDVFSGSGAIAFEGLSRGIEQADLIEKSKKAAAIIKHNINSLDLVSQTTLHIGEAEAILMTLKIKYDIIFMDPPYKYQNYFDLIDIAGKLLRNQESIMILETDRRALFDIPDYLECVDIRKYGESKIYFIRMR